MSYDVISNQALGYADLHLIRSDSCHFDQW